MKKNCKQGWGIPITKQKKISTIMKLCFLFLIVFNFSVVGNTFAQKESISLNMENASLDQVIFKIKEQSEASFFFNLEKAKKEKGISINVKNETLDNVLNMVLKNTSLTFIVSQNTVILKDKEMADQVKDINVKGSVKDEAGFPLPGVTVMVKGTSVGVSTDFDGKFSIKLPEGKNILVFSFIGMETKEINVTGKNDVNVVLKTVAEQMEEIVVTGYGNIEKRKLSSSVITVKGEALVEGATSTIDNMLVGKVAGVSVLNSTSTPGAAPKIRIRGSSSIIGNREPVWVVDGVVLENPVPISATELNSLDRINLVGNAISSLNPEDIDRIDVLKDASATAIYGVKAANGVIVITTKKGKKGEPMVRYSTNFTVSERPQYDKLNRMNSMERIDVSKEIHERGLAFGLKPAPIAYEGALYDYYAKNITYDEFAEKVRYMEQVNTDWFDILFRTGLSQKHSVSISGANDKVNYYFSGSFDNNKGTSRFQEMSRYNGLMKLGVNLTDKFKVELQLRGSADEKDYQYSSIDPFQYAYGTSRAIPCYDENGDLSYYNKSQGHLTQLRYNILNEINNSDRTIESQSLNFITNATYRLDDNLKFNVLFSYNKNNTFQKEWFNDRTYEAAVLRHLNYGDEFPDSPEFYNKQCSLPYGGMLKNASTKNTSYTARAGATYKLNFLEKHFFSTTLGTELRSTSYQGVDTKEYGYLPQRGDKFVFIDPTIFKQYLELLKESQDIVTDRTTNMLSFYGTFTYDYDNRYVANFNIRTDGSNKFGRDKKSRFLPVWSVSGRWNAHNEAFLENIEWLDVLAIRGSYGIQGNVAEDQTPYLIIELGSRDDVSAEYLSNLVKLPNPALKWEKTTSYNVACDAEFLDGRVGGSVDFYYKKGEDMIISKRVDVTTGSSSMQLNAGTLLNKGVDISLNLVPVRTKDFSWMVSVNGAKNINKVTESRIDKDFEYFDYVSGDAVFANKPLNSFYSYQFDGLDKNGYPTYKNIEETDGITKEEMFKNVFTYSGKRIPDFTGGFSTSFSYKNWSLNCIFSYSIGSHLRLNPLYLSTGQSLPQPQQNMDNIFVNRWRKPGDENHTNIPVLSNEKLSINTEDWDVSRTIPIGDNLWDLYNNSDFRVISGDFLRFRTATLRYSLDNKICKRIGLAGATFKLEASNIKVWADKKLRGQDPEQISFTFNTGAVPLTPTYTVGVDINF